MPMTVVIYSSILFGIGHNVRRWAEAVERRYTANAIAFAPVNKRAFKSHWDIGYPPGSLKAGISGGVDRIGPKMLETVIYSSAPYSIFVIEGTGRIYPDSAPKLRLPFNAGRSPLRSAGAAWGNATFHESVSGQRANNFLAKAHDATAARHPSLRRSPGSVFRSG